MNAPWLPSVLHPDIAELVRRGLDDILICEDPPGSNRGPEIDEYNRRAGVPAASYWCAAAVGAWWQDCGFAVPRGYASCDVWMQWAKAAGTWHDKPAYGAAVLYGVPGDARHIGLVVRITPLIATVEGNTTIEGGGFSASRNGSAVSVKEITPTDPVLGYVWPTP